MSRFLRFFFILSLLFNAVLIVWMGTKWMKRFQRQEWVVLHHRMTKVVSPSMIYFLGDSQLETLYHSGVLNEKSKIENLAMSGARVRDLIRVLEEFPVVKEPVRLILLIGINDLRGGQSVDQLMRNYETLGPLIQEKFPNNECVVLSLLPLMESLQINEPATNESIQEANARIKSWVDQQNFLYLDLFSTFSVNGSLPSRLTFDGLHLNLEGNRLFRRQLAGFLK